MPSAPQNKLEGDGEPVKFTLPDYLARLKHLVAEGDEHTLDKLIHCYRVCDHFAVRVFRYNNFRHAPTIAEGNSTGRHK